MRPHSSLEPFKLIDSQFLSQDPRPPDADLDLAQPVCRLLLALFVTAVGRAHGIRPAAHNLYQFPALHLRWPPHPAQPTRVSGSS